MKFEDLNFGEDGPKTKEELKDFITAVLFILIAISRTIKNGHCNYSEIIMQSYIIAENFVKLLFKDDEEFDINE